MKLSQGFTELREAFQTAGVHLVQDPRDLQIPGAIATPDRVTRTTLGAASVEWNIYLIPADNGHPLAGLDALLDNLDSHGLSPATAEFVTISLPNHAPDPLPAARLTITTEN